MSLNKYPGESARVRAGQRLDVGAGATKLPQPVKVDLEEIMRTSPLITDFPPLPSQDLILAAIRDQNSSHTTHKSSPPSPSGGGSTTQAGPAVYPSQPVNTGGPPPPTYWPTGLGRIDPDWPGGTSHRTHRTKDTYPKKSGDGEPGHGKPGHGETGQVPSRYRPTPTPTPSKKSLPSRLPARPRPKPTPTKIY